MGVLYDPFVGRAPEPWSFGIYAGGQSILVGTPSGVSLAPEGGAHQSVIAPSIGLEQPGIVAYEPAFAVDTEWTLLASLSRLGRPDGSSAYLRLSTRPVDQTLARVPADPAARERRRRQVVAGAYPLRGAGEAGGDGGALRARSGQDDGGTAWILDQAFPASRAAPLVTVLDGHPHTLAFLASVRRVPCVSLGMTSFGQSGALEDVYRYHGIDADSIVRAALDAAG